MQLSRGKLLTGDAWILVMGLLASKEAGWVWPADLNDQCGMSGRVSACLFL